MPHSAHIDRGGYNIAPAIAAIGFLTTSAGALGYPPRSPRDKRKSDTGD